MPYDIRSQVKGGRLKAVVALGCAHGQRSYIDPTAGMNPEPAAMWSRPQEVGYTLGERIRDARKRGVRIR